MNRKKSSKNKTTRKKKTGAKRLAKPSSESLPLWESLESLPDGLVAIGSGKPSAVEEAQEIMYEAWEAPTAKRAAALAKKALAVSADCADAYNLLAKVEAKSLEEAIDFYRKGVGAGERALGEKTFKEDVGYFWGILKTRPYMRNRADLARCLWEVGQCEEAVEHYWDLLRLNPNDNQGIRDLLMPSLIQLDRDEDAERLHQLYEEDGMAVWMYSRALLDFRKHGDSSIAEKSLKAARKENKHVPAYLLARKKMPKTLPGYYSFGDEAEAVLYTHANGEAWKTSPGALEWLSSKIK